MTKAKILVVDDEEHMASALVERLEADGHKVESVSDGELALAALKEEKYDLMLIDLRLPGMSGLETIDAMWDDKDIDRKHMAVIVLSSVDNPVVSKYVYAKGYSFLIKADNSLDDIATFVVGELKKKKG